MPSVGFPWQPVLELLKRNRVICRGILGRTVGTQGDGPYSEDEFDDLLEECGIRPTTIDDMDAAVLVLGRDDWDPSDLDAAIEARAGSRLRVYSQEMVIAALAVGDDLFELCDEDELEAFGDGHPALEYLTGLGFEWPTTEVTVKTRPLLIDFDASGWPAVGVLRQLGYHVGQSGPSANQRRDILSKVLEANLAGGVGDDATGYIASWGLPGSMKRLEKTANSIAAFVRSAKRKTSADYSVAIAEWESDLVWLRATHHTRACNFSWPDTSV